MGRGWPLGFAAEITRRAAEYGKDADPEGLDPRRGLQPDGLYYLTKVQVDNILAMNLRRLTGLEREKILADYAATMERIFDLIDILHKPERVTAIIKEEPLPAVKPMAMSVAQQSTCRKILTLISATLFRAATWLCRSPATAL